ncbi:protein-disulfide reductase DsbD family protein [Tamlana sp. 2_MG-2023]|uniref:protein-disulfide reductase DsbD domain-containing protein n=1 Tax=unclassified Tamlana TaxID=2614803 RepID=UPI0026E34C54|nr:MULTISPECIES: protein-disulfide reductase DsbD domain-containing protein [unclassified Tamlana]MDO6761621.1 protein-disulfide reductase DsbD family protein [Tamlana sp. 2_MG-2023]MDO6792407.1 protein-disulfide reductase DsbD family protein [Tamlana sp. 1_MG-2023]
MKRFVLILALLLSTMAFSQIHNPVKWNTAVKKISDTEALLIATAKIEAGWHLYSQSVPENGPIPTSFTFEGNSNYLKKGNTKEGDGHKVNDPVFEMVIKFFDKEAQFKQRVKLKNKETFNIKAVVEFMVCNDTQCLAPTEIDLVFKIK